MREFSKKIVSMSSVGTISKKLKSQRKKIVTTNGVFDILHLGHISYLESARKLGDVLIVGINSDASVKRLKGPKRPLNSEKARASCIAALECVDYVIMFNDDDPRKLLSTIKPSIHVKGGDYRGKEHKIIEKEVIENNGGKIVLKQMIRGYSTTSLIDKIVDVYGK